MAAHLDAHALTRLRHSELQRTHSAMARLVTSMAYYETAYVDQGRRLLMAEAALAQREADVEKLKAEVATLSAEIRLSKNSKLLKAGIDAAEKTNTALKRKQRHSSLNDLSVQLERTHMQLKTATTFSELRERKFEAELKARADRIAKLQKTIRNLTELRAGEEQKQRKRVETAQAEQKAALMRASDAQSQMEALRLRAEAAEAAAAKSDRDVADRTEMLQKTASLLRGEQDRNAALKAEMVRAVGMFDERLRENTVSFVETLKEEREWRTKALGGVSRLNAVVESKAGWLDVMSVFVPPPLESTRTGRAVTAALS